MKFKAKGLSTQSVIIIVVGWVMFVCALGLLICWGALSAWNLLVTSAGWSYSVPISWGTVFGLWMVLVFLNLVFRRSKE